MSDIPPELRAFFEDGDDETDEKSEAAQIWEKGVEGLLSDLELQITKHDTPGEDNVVTRDFTNAFDFIVSGPDDFSIGFYLATLAGLLEQRQKHPDSSAGENAQLRRTRDAIKKWLAGEDPSPEQLNIQTEENTIIGPQGFEGITPDYLVQRAEESQTPSHRKAYRAVAWRLRGLTVKQIMKKMDVSQSTVQKWTALVRKLL